MPRTSYNFTRLIPILNPPTILPIMPGRTLQVKNSNNTLQQ